MGSRVVKNEEKVSVPVEKETRSPNPALELVTVVKEITRVQLFKSEIYFFGVCRLVHERKMTISFVISVRMS